MELRVEGKKKGTIILTIPHVERRDFVVIVVSEAGGTALLEPFFLPG